MLKNLIFRNLLQNLLKNQALIIKINLKLIQNSILYI